jgi:hypothetical protein
MNVRRIITGHASDGKAVFLADESTPRSHDFEHVPGFAAALVWGTAPLPSIHNGQQDPTSGMASWVPPVGGANLMVITFPPESATMNPLFDPAAAGAETVAVLPGLAEQFEAANPGMHTTDTIDYGVLLEGELWLELDDGKETLVRRHDIVIQQGTRHAWRNRSDKPATMVFVLVGANRAGPDRTNKE